DVLSGGVTYRLEPETLQFGPVHEDGVVVWYRDEAASGAPTGDLHVIRVAVQGGTDQLAHFLGDRQVDARVHYVLWEGGCGGVRWQVMDEAGRAQELGRGCHEDLVLDGSDKPARVAAVALTQSGRTAMLDDLTTFCAGDPNGLFAEPTSLCASLPAA